MVRFLRSLLEDKVLDGDIYGLISPYATANFWVSFAEWFIPKTVPGTDTDKRCLPVVAFSEEVPLPLLRPHPSQLL